MAGTPTGGSGGAVSAWAAALAGQAARTAAAQAQRRAAAAAAAAGGGGGSAQPQRQQQQQQQEQQQQEQQRRQQQQEAPPIVLVLPEDDVAACLAGRPPPQSKRLSAEWLDVCVAALWADLQAYLDWMAADQTLLATTGLTQAASQSTPGRSVESVGEAAALGAAAQLAQWLQAAAPLGGSSDGQQHAPRALVACVHLLLGHQDQDVPGRDLVVHGKVCRR
ncbi:hypothetical protein FOA52_012867 [Chlamydomonas sp. UWO 241]|nr:hypothetical protein FOA52_012867 [Chlamydomonas sp. UWO 241]